MEYTTCEKSDTLKEAIFELYKKTLPDVIRSEDTVREIISRPDNHIISHREHGAPVGVSVIGGNVIYLLCVDEPFQKQGVGSALLKQSEEAIASKGFEKAVTGAGDSYIMPGVPMNRSAHLFFQKRGYRNSWGENGSFDMSQDLAGFSLNAHTVGDVINGVRYRWAEKGDMDGIAECVTEAQSFYDEYDPADSFVKYYRTTDDPVLVAVKDGEIIGALIVGIDAEGPGVGSLACAVTRPKHMGKGVATQMVILGTKHLKDAGLPKAFLGYTYKEITHMYARAGYTVCMEYYMGEKSVLRRHAI